MPKRHSGLAIGGVRNAPEPVSPTSTMACQHRKEDSELSGPNRQEPLHHCPLRVNPKISIPDFITLLSGASKMLTNT
eukprot:6077747-Amphidinium_carterae.1